MIDITKLSEQAFAPDEDPQRESARNDEPPRKIGPVDRYGFPTNYAYRRAFSNQELQEQLTEDLFRNHWTSVFLSRGNVDLVSYLELIARMQRIERLGVATFSANPNDIRRIRILAEQHRIAHTMIYLGTVFHHSAQEDRSIDVVNAILEGAQGIQAKIIKNHAKVIFGYGERYHFAVVSSANLNTNFNIEATVVIPDRVAYQFCRKFFESAEEVER